MPQFNHPLMYNNFSKSDINCVIKFLKNNNILTQNKKVYEFEKKWSQWLGVKYSVFVNSGASANLISINITIKQSQKKHLNKIVYQTVLFHQKHNHIL